MEESLFKRALAVSLELEASALNARDNLEELGWDSLSFMSFVSQLEQMGIDPDETLISKAQTVGDILAACQQPGREQKTLKEE